MKRKRVEEVIKEDLMEMQRLAHRILLMIKELPRYSIKMRRGAGFDNRMFQLRRDVEYLHDGIKIEGAS